MLKLDNITFSYCDKTNVLENVSMELSEGTITGLIGLNGAGKTTLFNIIFGFIDPDKGEVTFNGKKLERKDITYLDEDNFFYSNLTGGEYLGIFPDKQEFLNVQNLAEIFGIPMNEMISNYSSGMKKKLAILSVLKTGKTIMLLDEPFNELDLESSKVIEIVLKELAKSKKTILVSSHILDPLISICDSIYILKSHRISKEYLPLEYQNIRVELFDGFEEKIFERIKK